jgi:hypothetical protein
MNQNQPTPGTQPAQSATESIAQRRVRLYIGGSLDLQGCDLKGVQLPASIGGFAMPTKEEQSINLRNVAEKALKTLGCALKMDTVHACETTHCMAGWSTTIHPLGKEMENKLGWETAGLMLLGTEAHGMFRASDEDARAFLQAALDEMPA